VPSFISVRDVDTHQQIKVLRNISGGPNIVALLDVVRDSSHAYHSLVMEYVNNTDWKVLLRSMNELDMKYYMFQLLKVRVSSPMKIMYRGVPPRPLILFILGVSSIVMSNQGML